MPGQPDKVALSLKQTNVSKTAIDLVSEKYLPFSIISSNFDLRINHSQVLSSLKPFPNVLLNLGSNFGQLDKSEFFKLG